MTHISETCQAVGFNTIPSWRKPFAVLSNGEQFRVSLARRLLEHRPLVVVDEFTSVVDRQVAKIGAHAAAKYARKNALQFVAVTCHYDVIDWLAPDWILEMPSGKFSRPVLLRRPEIRGVVSPVDYAAWHTFAPFHYLTAELNRSAKCFCLFVEDRPAAFGGVVHFPHATAKNIKRLSRLVTLPDWQGLGLAFVLTDTLASAYKANGFRFRTYPAHPALIRAFDKSEKWTLVKKPGTFQAKDKTADSRGVGGHGGRPCAVFEWSGPANAEAAKVLLLG